MLSALCDCSAGPIDPTIVTSRPSRIQVIPSATSTSIWKRLNGSRSSRAGMSVVIAAPCVLASKRLPSPLRC